VSTTPRRASVSLRAVDDAPSQPRFFLPAKRGTRERESARRTLLVGLLLARLVVEDEALEALLLGLVLLALQRRAHRDRRVARDLHRERLRASR